MRLLENFGTKVRVGSLYEVEIHIFIHLLHSYWVDCKRTCRKIKNIAVLITFFVNFKSKKPSSI